MINGRPCEVIRVGGTQLDRPAGAQRLLQYLAPRCQARHRIVVVHGGGAEVDQLHHRLDVPLRHTARLRVMSETSMDIVTMVVCGVTNKRLVASLNTAGYRAVGLCGADFGFMCADPINIARFGRVGGLPRVDPQCLRDLLADGAMPVIAPICLGPRGGLLDVDADLAAQAVATALGAERLEFITDGERPPAPSGHGRTFAPEELKKLLRRDVIADDMITTVQAAVAAINGGVQRVRLGTLMNLEHGTATEVRA